MSDVNIESVLDSMVEEIRMLSTAVDSIQQRINHSQNQASVDHLSSEIAAVKAHLSSQPTQTSSPVQVVLSETLPTR